MSSPHSSHSHHHSHPRRSRSSHHHPRHHHHHHRESSDSQDSNSNSTGVINIITSKKQGINTFANDGSFMELFKKKMEEEAKAEAAGSGNSEGEGNKTANDKLKTLESSVKKRSNKVLKTGLVKKQKVAEDGDEPPPTTDAWSRYMAEVKKYRQQACDEDGKTRPLVK